MWSVLLVIPPERFFTHDAVKSFLSALIENRKALEALAKRGTRVDFVAEVVDKKGYRAPFLKGGFTCSLLI
jgi:hypothetical protein